MQNSLLFSGSGCWYGADPMTDFPRELERGSAIETWALALATALVALIAVGVLPRVYW